MRIITKTITIGLVLLCAYSLQAQTNIISTNPIAEEILTGNYNPTDYAASSMINHPDSIIHGVNDRINADSLRSFLESIVFFENRNTGSDTVSNTFGIGAARRWGFSKFQQFSLENENRLIPSYLQFDQTVCSMDQHRNVFAVLPGTDANGGVIIIEGHLDSRCDDECDSLCTANGAEDNGSGSALVVEMARVMSKYTFEKTMVFMLTIGEEQGLIGADAFSLWATQKNIQIKAVMNNDVIGGILCGETSSAPSCPGLDNVDSTQVRIFSQGVYNSQNKMLARYSKLQYNEELRAIVDVPMMITIMTGEDRIGRGGDHIPFREDGFPAIRYTAANEHGNADVGVDYNDRQHTIDDLIGVDTNNDMVIDSFFVDFNYLARNAVINGVTAGLIGNSPETPDFMVSSTDSLIFVEITSQTQYMNYRVAMRTTFTEWDTVYTITNGLSGNFSFIENNTYHYISVASVDEHGIESCFGEEQSVNRTTSIEEYLFDQKVELLQNRPNPFDEATAISILVHERFEHKEAYIRITDLTGKEIWRKEVELNKGMIEVVYNHGYQATGQYLYSLIIDNNVIATRSMVFAY